MKNAIVKIFILLVTGILINKDSVCQNAPQYLADSLQSIIDKSLPSGVQNPGVVVGVHVPGKWSWSGASGSAISGITNGYPATVATETTKFRIGSITKTFVATTIMQLEEDGLLSIDDNISLHLRSSLVNDTINGSDVITIRHLLNHTSGIGNSADNDSCKQDALNNLTRTFSLEEGIFCGASQGENFPPGFAWGYSNTNYSLLAMIIENVSGKSFQEYVTENIILPLSLSNTEFPATDEINAAHMGCYWNIGFWIDMTIVDASLYRGWADIVSTTKDLNTFYKALRNGNIISAASFAKMKTIDPVSYDYGLGLDFYKISNIDYYGHSGEVANTSGMFFANISTSEFPDGYYISYNFNYQGVDTWTVLDEPVFNLIKNYVASSINKNQTQEATFEVYPNPAKDQINIIINDSGFSEFTIEVTDLSGRVVKNTLTNTGRLMYDVSDLENGVCFVKVFNEETSLIKKVCISR